MLSQKIKELKDYIYSLSQEEQQILLEKITKKISLKNKLIERFSNKERLEKEIAGMANDPEIQAEISAINQ